MLKILDEKTSLSEYSPIMIFKKNVNFEVEIKKILTYGNSTIKSIIDKFNLTIEDFKIWDSYGEKWLVIKKNKVNNIYFIPRSFIFLEFSNVGDKVDFGDSLYKITSKNRSKPNSHSIETWNLNKNDKTEMDMYTSSSIRLVYIKKDGKIGKRGCWITNYPSPVNDEVNIKFTR